MQELVRRWSEALKALHERIAPHFYRTEPRARSLGYLQGLLSTVKRKNGWQLAEQMGQRCPDGVQRLLDAARWDEDGVRDELRRYVVQHLGDEQAVLVVDETGFLKKGTQSVGVKRQYSGTAGRIENSQVGVFLCYASARGSAFIDRALYLPREWAEDAQRRAQAHVPQAIPFQTKPALALAMIERALDAGVPCGWVTGDEVYGADRTLRWALEQRGQPFVLAVARTERLWWQGPQYRAAWQIAEQLPDNAWQRLSAADGAKGPRQYDWAWVPLWRLQLDAHERQWAHGLLMRRSVKPPHEMAYYVTFSPREATALHTLAQVAGQRWNIEVGFEAAKQECGLDEYEVRTWAAWHRHITLALLAHAFLVVMRAQAKKGGLCTAC